MFDIRKTTIWLLLVNAAFWLVYAIYFSFLWFWGRPEYLIIKILLFMEPILYVGSLWGFVKRNRYIYICSVLFVFANTILSITDQFGILDLLSLGISFVCLVGLLANWAQIFKKKP